MIAVTKKKLSQCHERRRSDFNDESIGYDGEAQLDNGSTITPNNGRSLPSAPEPGIESVTVLFGSLFTRRQVEKSQSWKQNG